MTNPATNILPALIAFALMTGAASAQQNTTTIYDAGGRNVGRTTTSR